jgi:DNA-binding transcriptional LysR family regulator
LPAACRILSDLRETEQAISDQSAPRGRLRVSTSILYGRMFLVPLLGEFVRRYPDILLDINMTDEIVDIAGGQADVGVRSGPLVDGPLTVRKLGETRKVIVASPDYLARRGTPEIPEDLHDHDCLGFNFKRAAPTRPFRKDGREYSLAIRGRLETNNGETLGQLATEGVGITRVGADTVQDAMRRGTLVPLLERFNPGDVEEINAVFVGGAHMPARDRGGRSMNGQARLTSSDLQAVDERELTRVVQTRVESMGRQSVHPADRVQRPISPRRSCAIQGANYVVLQGPPAACV